MCLKSLKSLILSILLPFLVMSSNFGPCNAWKIHHQRVRRRKPESSLTSIPDASIFNVLDYGANGDGVTDDTKAFQSAWSSACKVAASTVVVPSKYIFLVGPISFTGPCQPNIVFQLDGTIMAPTSPNTWGSGILQWLEFKKLGGMRIQGNGIIEGQGSVWWTKSELNIEEEMDNTGLTGHMPHTKPTALRFYGSYNVSVTGITIQNSPQCHLKFDDCQAVQVYNITVNSPGDSPNTDGIHLQNSIDVSIYHTDLRCGDDCISIQTGCSNIYVHDVNCGPGHGISLGSLGKDRTKACISNVTIQNAVMNNTMNGVRIKTCQGGYGSARNIKFSNIQVTEVKTPIDIDQYYCDGGPCKNQSSAVALSQISYENITGTYTVQPVHLACSENIPCVNISLTDIELKPIQEHTHVYDAFCWEAYGELHAPTIPPIDCLKSQEKISSKILSDQDSC